MLGHVLERNGLSGKPFANVGEHLQAKGLVARTGVIVETSRIVVLPSTNSQVKSRDPEMRETGKGKDWRFGMRLDVGTSRSGTVHSLTATHAAPCDITE